MLVHHKLASQLKAGVQQAAKSVWILILDNAVMHFYITGLGCSQQRWHYLGIKSILALNQLDLEPVRVPMDIGLQHLLYLCICLHES
jgi:hypothetical protein